MVVDQIENKAAHSVNKKNIGFPKERSSSRKAKEINIKLRQEKSNTKVETTYYSAIPKNKSKTFISRIFNTSIILNPSGSTGFGNGILTSSENELQINSARDQKKEFYNSLILVKNVTLQNYFLRGPPLNEV